MSRGPKSLCVGGWNVLDAALRAGCVVTVHVDAGQVSRARGAGADEAMVRPYERGALADRFGPEAKQGVVSELKPLEFMPVANLEAAAMARGLPLVVLEEVQDPQNLGSVARAARALGAVGLVLTKHRSAPLSAAAVRASAGALLGLPVAAVGGVPNWLQRLDPLLPALAAVKPGAAADAVAPWAAPLDGPCALLLGGEGGGLKRLTVERAAARVTIPQADWESLNVAQAATVLLYAAAARRGGG